MTVAVRSGVALLAALFVASLALRPQLVGIGPLLPDIEADLGVSHAVAGLLGTIPVLCMGLFAPAAAPLTAWASLRTAIGVCVFGVAAFGMARAAAPDAGLVLALTLPLGVGLALAGALLPVAVKARFADRPAFATGVYTTGLSVGAALASALAVPLADVFGKWRGALAALVLLGGYTLSSLSPVGLGALRDATGSFSPVLWTMFGAGVVLLASCLPLTADRLRPA